DNCVPVEVGEVGRGNAKERTVDTSIETSGPFLSDDAGYGVPGRVVHGGVGIGRALAVGSDLNLKASLDAVCRNMLAAIMGNKGRGRKRLTCRAGRRGHWREPHQSLQLQRRPTGRWRAWIDRPL